MVSLQYELLHVHANQMIKKATYYKKKQLKDFYPV
jgi:hypothetical protein